MSVCLCSNSSNEREKIAARISFDQVGSGFIVTKLLLLSSPIPTNECVLSHAMLNNTYTKDYDLRQYQITHVAYIFGETYIQITKRGYLD